MRPTALGIALAVLVACGAAPGTTDRAQTRDANWKDPNSGRSDYTPARDADRSNHHLDKASTGKGK